MCGFVAKYAKCAVCCGFIMGCAVCCELIAKCAVCRNLLADVANLLRNARFVRFYGGPYVPNRQRPKFASSKCRPIKISPYLTTILWRAIPTKRLTARNPEALCMKALHTQALHMQALYMELYVRRLCTTLYTTLCTMLCTMP